MTSIVANSAGAAYLGGLFGAFERSQSRVATGKFIFSAQDDSTRYRLSETLLSRTRKIDAINSNISTVLGRLEATDQTLKALIGMAEDGLALARKAQNSPPVFFRGVNSAVAISGSSVISAAVGARLSVTSDSGQNFTYTITRPNTTWGDIAEALNAAGMGIRAEFVPGYALGQTFLRFVSSNGRDFSFDGISDETIMDDLAGTAFIAPASTQAMANATDANSFFGASGVVTSTETGFTVGYGGSRTGAALITAATVIPAGSMLVFEDGTGTLRTLTYPVGSTAGQVVSDINVLAPGIRAELVNEVNTGLLFRMRNTYGGALKIVSATGAFSTAGALAFSPPTGTTVNNVPNLALVSANLVNNGSFDVGFLGPGSVPTGWTDLGTGPIGLDNTVGRVNHGSQYLPFGGWSNATGGAIQQVIATVPGVQYTLQLDIGGMLVVNARLGALRVQALDGPSTLVDQTVTLPAMVAPYQSYGYTFTASSSATTIRLTDMTVAGPGDSDIDVDNVRLTTQALDAGDNSLRLNFGHQYDVLRNSMAAMIANNGGLPDRNLLTGRNILLGLDEFDEKKLLITGTSLSVTGSLGMAMSGGTWYTDSNIQASVVQALSALRTLRDVQARLATFTDHIKGRAEILASAGVDMKVNGDALVGADMAEESAVMTAIRTRMDFAEQSLVASNRNQQGLLRLLG